MAGLNKVQLIGHLGKDPEMRHLENGSKVCNFSMATSEMWKDKQTGERKTRTEWHNIVVWGPLADVCSKYLKKGSQIYCGGKIRTRMWEKEGVKHYTTEIFMDDLVMLGSKDGNQQPNHQHQAPASNAQESNLGPDPGSDDLPF